MEMRQLPVREKLTLEEKRKGEETFLGIHTTTDRETR